MRAAIILEEKSICRFTENRFTEARAFALAFNTQRSHVFDLSSVLKIQRFNFSVFISKRLSLLSPRNCSPSLLFSAVSLRALKKYPKVSGFVNTILMESEANVTHLPRIRTVPDYPGRSWFQW